MAERRTSQAGKAETRRGAGAAEDPALPGAEALARLQQAQLASLGWLGTDWAARMQEIGQEVADFVAARIQEDMKTQHALMNCKSPAEVQEVQLAFLTRAFEDYSAETGKLVEMTQQMMADAADGAGPSEAAGKRRS